MLIRTARIGAFTMLAVGTIGLIINEFVFNWGRAGTISLAAVNLEGLVTLACLSRGMGKKPNK